MWDKYETKKLKFLSLNVQFRISFPYSIKGIKQFMPFTSLTCADGEMRIVRYKDFRFSHVGILWECSVTLTHGS